jgi:tRNA dimethylallyltransferase
MGRSAIAITGATATGKTALAVDVAHALDGEVISMDSRQLYRGMDIGTATPTMAERRGVPHHGFDLIGPDERYSAGRFARDARRWITEIRGRGRIPILAGGTGFFLRALTEPLFDEPPLPAARRAKLSHWLERQSLDTLQRMARTLDPHGAVAREPANRQRLTRSVEVALLTGRPLPEWHAAGGGEPAADLLVFVLDLPRPELTARIHERVDAMVRAGLVDEVRSLLDAGYGPGDPGMSATGYAELIPHLRGVVALEEALEQIRAATRRYARRQATWFRHQVPADTIRLDASRPTAELTRDVAEAWQTDA